MLEGSNDKDQELEMNIKRIFIVTFASYAISLGVSIIVIVVSLPFNALQQATDIMFGSNGFLYRSLIAIVAFPFVWRYLKIKKSIDVNKQ